MSISKNPDDGEWIALPRPLKWVSTSAVRGWWKRVAFDGQAVFPAAEVEAWRA